MPVKLAIYKQTYINNKKLFLNQFAVLQGRCVLALQIRLKLLFEAIQRWQFTNFSRIIVPIFKCCIGKAFLGKFRPAPGNLEIFKSPCYMVRVPKTIQVECWLLSLKAEPILKVSTALFPPVPNCRTTKATHRSSLFHCRPTT